MVDKGRPTPAAIATLVQHRKQFLAFLARRLGSPSEAEDILQAAFAKGVEKSNSLRDDESVVAWFYRVLRNAVVDHYRHRDAERRALQWVAGMRGDGRPLEPSVDHAICQCVGGLLPTLKGEWAELLRRVDVGGESIAEVARHTGRTANNVRVTLHRARRALRKQVELTCGVCAQHACLDCDCRHAR